MTVKSLGFCERPSKSSATLPGHLPEQYIMVVLKHTLFALCFLPPALGVAIPDPSPKLVARKDWESPAYTWLYQFPLPIPPVKTPAM